MSSSQLFEANPEPQPIDDPFARLDTIQRTVGFLATDQRELNETLSLLAFPEAAGGSARHLNEILLHQQKARNKNPARVEDPARAVRHVTRDYARYFQSSLLNLTHLRLLNEEVEQTDNPFLNLKEALGPDVAGFGALVRFIDLQKAAKQGVVEGEINPLRNEYTPNPSPEMIEYISKRSQELSIGSIRDVVPLSIQDQEKRGQFWQQRLNESRRHALAQPIATAALAKLA